MSLAGEKSCTRCRITKKLIDFPARKISKDGHTNICKTCAASYKRKYVAANKDKVKANWRQYATKNKELLARRRKRYKLAHRAVLNEKQKQYNQHHKEEKAQYDKAYYASNKDEINTRATKKRETNVNYRIAANLRTRLNHAMAANQKVGSAVSDLGCSVEFLKRHLETMFYANKETNEPMTWDNYGFYGWHIDHIKPLASFDLTDAEQFKRACHYTNLQPMWAKENFSKNKY